jgi:hypothetical protein
MTVFAKAVSGDVRAPVESHLGRIGGENQR